MTQHYFSCRKPTGIPPLMLPGSVIKVPGTPVNVLDHYASEYRAKGTSIIEIERFLYGDEIYNWSFGYDIGPQIDEDSWPQFKRWKEFTEATKALDVVPIAKEIGYKESSRERAVEGAHFVHDSDVDLPLNKVGLYVSKAENVRQALNNYLNTDEAQLFNKFMKSKGYSLKQGIDSFVVGYIPKNAIAAVHRKEHFFAFNKNFRDMIAKSAKAHNVEFDDEKFYTVAHELVHLYGIDSEEELENLMLEFYLKIANKEPEGYTNHIPKSIRSEKEKYSRKAIIPLSRLIAQGKTPLVRNIETLTEKLYSEAKDMGLNEEEAKQYVEASLEDHIKSEKTDYAEESVNEKGEIAGEEAAECSEASDASE